MRAPLKALLRLGAAALVVVALAWTLDLRQLGATLVRIDVPTWAAAVAAAVVANIASAWRWAGLSRRLAVPLPFTASWRAYAESVVLNNVLPGSTLGGDAFRALVLQRRGARLLDAALTVLLDRGVGVWIVALVAGVAALALSAQGALDAHDPWLTRAYALTLLGVLAGPPVAMMLGPLLIRVLPLPAGRLRDILALAVSRLPAVNRAALAALGPSLLVQLLSMLAFALCLRSAGATVDATTVAYAAGFVFLGVALPVSVGGYGVRELASVAILAGAGVSAEPAAVGGLLYGLAATVQALVAWPLFLLDRPKVEAGAAVQAGAAGGGDSLGSPPGTTSAAAPSAPDASSPVDAPCRPAVRDRGPDASN